MLENLKPELDVLLRYKNSSVHADENNNQLIIKSDEEATIKTLNFHDFTVVERFYLSHLSEIEKWPRWKINSVKSTATISENIEQIDNKNNLPISVLRSIVLSIIEENPQEKVFTDGSIMPTGDKGIGVHRNNKNISLRVINSMSSTSVELNAIKAGLENLWAYRQFNNIMYTDSQAAAKLLKAGNMSDENETIVQDILWLLNKTSTTIKWIPSHINISGNDQADELAKAGSQQDECYKNEKCTVKDVKIKIRDYTNEKWKKWFENEKVKGKGLKSDAIIKSPSEKFWFEKFDERLSGVEIKILNRIISGHDLTPASRKFIINRESDQCEMCKELNDAKHQIFICKKFPIRKFQISTNVIEWIRDAKRSDVKEVVEFIKKNQLDI
jgi:ribonuclease HI